MAKVLISLVSQQRVPNVLAIQDVFFKEIDRYLFISTPEMEEKGVVGHMLRATDIASDMCQKVMVPEDSLQDIHQALMALPLSQEDAYYINLTGGTKIMSLAVFSFFNAAKWQATYFYLPIAKNIIQQIFLDQENREIPITFQFGVEEYLISYGLKIEAGDFSPPLKPYEVSRQILDYYLLQKKGTGTHQFWQITGRIRDFRNKEEGVEIAAISNLSSLIAQLQMPLQVDSRLTAPEVKFLTGGWLEEWIYQEVKAILGLNEKAIGRNLKINWLGIAAEHGKNELDVVFMYRNTIHIIECKAGLGKKNEVKDQFIQALNQLAVLRKEMGLRVKMAFVTLSTNLRNDNGDFDEVYVARSNVLDITILDRNNIIPGLKSYLEGL